MIMSIFQVNLLQAHAALFKILHASEAVKHIDKIMKRRDEIRDLASDDSFNLQKLLFAFSLLDSRRYLIGMLSYLL